MKINMHIIADELRDEISEVHIMSGYDLELTGVRFLMQGESASNDYVYVSTVSSYEHIKITWTEDNFPYNLIILNDKGSYKTSVKNNISCIIVNTQETLYQLFNRIQDIFISYSEREASLIEAFLMQKSLKEIIEIYSSFISNPLILCDRSGFVVCYSSNVPYPPTGFWSIFLPHGYYDMNLHIKDNPHSSFDFYNAILYEHPIMVSDLNQGIILFNIFVDGVRIGDLQTAETYAPLTNGQYSLMCYFQKSLQEYISSRGAAFMMKPNTNILISQALHGEEMSPLLLSELFEHQSWKKDDLYYVIKIMVRENSVIKNTELGYCSTLLSKKFPNAMVVEENDTLAVVLQNEQYPYPSCDPTTAGGREPSSESEKSPILKVLSEMVSLVSVKCAISMLYNDFAQISLAAKQCDIVLENIRKEKNSESIVFFDDCYQSLLKDSLLSGSDNLAFCLPEIIMLKEYDQNNESDLIATLYEVLRTGLRYSEAADNLSIHRNTLTYRLRRITELTGLDLSSYTYIDRLLISCILVM